MPKEIIDPCKTCNGEGSCNGNICPACSGDGKNHTQNGRDWLD